MTGLVVTQGLWKPRCPFCRTAVDTATLVAGPQICEKCGRRYEATPFPVERTTPERAPVSLAAVPGAATPCAYHPANAAEGHCDRCGVVMCALCRIDLEDRRLCAPCFDRLSESRELRLARTRAPDFRGLAWLSVIGSFFFYFAPILGPAAIVFGILALRQHKREGGAGPGLVSSGVAIGCGVLVTATGLFFVFAIIAALMAAKPS